MHLCTFLTHTHTDRPKVVEQVAPPPPPRPLCATCAREDVLTSKIAAEGHTVSPKQKYTRTNQPDRGEREYAFVLLSSAVVVRASDGKCIGHRAKATAAAAASSACDVPAMISDGRKKRGQR